MCCRCWLLGWMLCGCVLAMPGCRPSDEILLDDKRNPYVAYGNERRSANDFDGAITAYERALKVNPHSVRAHYELGMLYEKQKRDYVTALYHYNQVLKLQQSDYPVDNVKSLIGGCRQELVKQEALAPVTREMQRELENLRRENRRLQEELAALKATLASGLAPNSNPTSPTPTKVQPAPTPRTRTTEPSGRNASRSQTRTHRVRPGETLAAISRNYKVSLKALLEANPHVRPETMPVGTLIKIPGR